MKQHEVQQFLDIIRQLITQEFVDHADTTIICFVQSVNDDGSLNIYIEPDRSNIIHNVPNMSPFTFSQGDKAILYKRRNKIADSFIIAKNGATLPLTGLTMEAVKYIQQKLTGSSTQNIEINQYTQESGSGSGGGGGSSLNWSADATTTTGEPGTSASVTVSVTQTDTILPHPISS